MLNLLRHVPQDDNWRVFVLVQPSFSLAGMPQNIERLEQSSLENPLKRAAWEEFCLASLVRRLNVDLFFSPGGLLPRSLPSSMLTAVTFQNMLPFDHLQRKKYSYGYRWLRDWLLERGLSSAMQRADLVVFISEFARDFISHKIGALQGKSIVAPHGIAPSFFPRLNVPLPRPAWLPEGEYFLYVSFIDHYKAQMEVVHGFDLYRQRGWGGKLVLVGAEYPPYGDLVRREIGARGLAGEVVLAGNVPHCELPAAYQHARVNLFASFIENCPNILLEMMASGRPALVSNRAPMTEFGGNTVAYFDPANPEDLARHLAELVDDEELQHRFAWAAMSRASDYSWEQAARHTWKAIATAGRNGGARQ